MRETPSSDKIRDALHGAVDDEPYAPISAHVVRRARRRLHRNVAISATIAGAIVMSVAIGGSMVADIDRTTPVTPANRPSVSQNSCCVPTESLLFQEPDGSTGFAPLDGDGGGTLVEGSQVLGATPDGSALLTRSSEGDLAISAGRHQVIPVVRTDRSFAGASIAPDGRHVAIATDGRLIERTVGRRGFRVLVPVEIGPTLTNPAWSPDGNRIAYIRSASGNDLMVVNRRTGRSRLVLAAVAAAAWSPDGTHLVVARPKPDFTFEIDVTDLQGDLTAVSPTPAAGFPTWSPDGSRIAFVGTDGRVVVADVDGMGETSLALSGIDPSATGLLWVPGQGG
jgi:hypothetical protein